MEIQNFINSPVFQETMAKFRNKPQENRRQAFDELITENENQAQIPKPAQDVTPNATADNGIKSAVLLGQLDLQRTQQKQSTGTMTTIKLTEGEKQLWDNNKVEGVRFANAGGVIFSGGTKKYNAEMGIYYTADMEYDYQFGAFYDENSPEDNPIIYLRKTSYTTTSLHYQECLNNDEIIKVEVSKVDPSNATYEEMIALVGYIYRDDPLSAGEACDAIDMARTYMEIDGLDWQNGPHNYTGYYLPEVVRRNKDYANPANQALAKATEPLLEYLKDYPRGIDNDKAQA